MNTNQLAMLIQHAQVTYSHRTIFCLLLCWFKTQQSTNEKAIFACQNLLESKRLTQTGSLHILAGNKFLFESMLILVGVEIAVIDEWVELSVKGIEVVGANILIIVILNFDVGLIWLSTVHFLFSVVVMLFDGKFWQYLLTIIMLRFEDCLAWTFYHELLDLLRISNNFCGLGDVDKLTHDDFQSTYFGLI